MIDTASLLHILVAEKKKKAPRMIKKPRLNTVGKQAFHEQKTNKKQRKNAKTETKGPLPYGTNQ